jgi:hypothetical protein
MTTSGALPQGTEAGSLASAHHSGDHRASLLILPRATFPGPARTIAVEPLRIPKAPSLPRKVPSPKPVPDRPERAPIRGPVPAP